MLEFALVIRCIIGDGLGLVEARDVRADRVRLGVRLIEGAGAAQRLAVRIASDTGIGFVAAVEVVVRADTGHLIALRRQLCKDASSSAIRHPSLSIILAILKPSVAISANSKTLMSCARHPGNRSAIVYEKRTLVGETRALRIQRL